MWVPVATARRTVRSGRSPYTVAAPRRRRCPQLGEPLDDGERRVAGDQRAVEGADAGAEDEVGGDAALEERPQHADLDRAEDAAAAEHERGGHRVDRPQCRTRRARGARRAPGVVARCSTQKISSGTSAGSSVTSVNADAPPGPAGEQERDHDVA